jgi:DNA-binding NarL/FixJ family response regulator
VKTLTNHRVSPQSKIVVVIGHAPVFLELALHILRNQHRDLKVCAVDDFAALIQLAKSLEKSIHIEKIIIFLKNNNEINLLSHINNTFPRTDVLAIVAFNPEDQWQSTFSADANSDRSRRGTSRSNPISGAAAKDMQFASPNLEGGFLSPARPGIKPPHSAPLSLTKREQEFLQLLHKGYSYASCAQAMDIGLSTVQTHIRNTYRKLSVTNNRQAILKAQSSGLLNF